MSALIAPSYYPAFTCIADRCRHNCCIGWEIDLDEKTYRSYQSLQGPLGERMKDSVSLEGGTPHFKLDQKERCPFLASDGLCDIIRKMGEDALCNICTDHPRFRNYYSGYTEIGLGLCCEEAARLIITDPGKVTLISLNQHPAPELTEEEHLLLQFREELTEIMQDRTIFFEKRLQAAAKRCNITLSTPKEILPILQQTERMDHAFDLLLPYLNEKHWASFKEDAWQKAMEQLCVYFLYRHLPAALEDGYLRERAAFALLSPLIIGTLAAGRMEKQGFSTELLLDTARLYSAEIEYSDKNLQMILSNLELT